jgi:hypothetical protein
MTWDEVLGVRLVSSDVCANYRSVKRAKSRKRRTALVFQGVSSAPVYAHYSCKRHDQHSPRVPSVREVDARSVPSDPRLGWPGNEAHRDAIPGVGEPVQLVRVAHSERLVAPRVYAAPGVPGHCSGDYR